MKKIICLTIYCLLITTGFAAPSNEKLTANTALSTDKLTINKQNETLIDKEKEIVLLRAQNNAIHEYQNSLLSTVHWALGGVFTMAFLLAGFGWWNNSRIYEVDKARTKEEIDSKLNNFDGKMNLRLEENRTEFLQLVDSKSESNASRFNSDISELRSKLESLENLIRDLETLIRKNEEKSTAARIQMTKTIYDQTSELREVEEHVWMIKGIPGNILITQAQGLQAAMNADNKYQVTRTLERMTKTLNENVIATNNTLPESAIQSIIRPLNAAEAYDPILVNKFRESLSKIQK